MSTVSVIIPCFNLGEYLPEAVGSIRRQTSAPSEVIIVNDGSTDTSTLRVLDRYASEGIHVFHTPNRGASAARNHGIQRARGDYILCLDADDVLLPEFLEETVPTLDADLDVGFVTTHVELFGMTPEHNVGGWRANGVWRTLGYEPITLLWQNCVGPSLFRRACWEQAGGYRTLKAYQDWNFWISIVEQGWRWTVIPKVLYRYRQRQGSISDYGVIHRPELLRELLALHADMYVRNFPAILVAMDAELQRLRDQLGKARQLSAAQVETIAALRAELDVAEKPDGSAAREVQDTAAVKYPEMTERLRQLASRTLPAQAVAAVVSRGDGNLLDFPRDQILHFPQLPDGTYAGYHPADSTEAIEHLEALRTKGAQYLIIPATALWWLDYYTELKQYLDGRYRLVEYQQNTGAVYDIRTAKELHTFSVVICTFRRAELVGNAIRSVFEQDYPRDKFELIVVDNDSPDDTGGVCRALQKDSPTPFTYLVEKKNGLSHARNLGIEHSTAEFVAFLDDDAVAKPDWLSALNTVIEERHALVVGGRVDSVYEEGFVPPDWFDQPYIRGFFGLNYSQRGKPEPVFRIQYPLYLMGANIAYAKRLFRHFGNFSTDLGRDGKSLAAAEETYMNLLLESKDIPIYYTDGAAVDHFIARDRVDRRHIRSKAYWVGISDAVMFAKLVGPRAALAKCRRSLPELKALIRSLPGTVGRPEQFSRSCRLVYNVAFLWKSAANFVQERLGLGSYQLADVAWTPQDWIDEVLRWADGQEKFTHLYRLYLSMNDEENARASLLQLERHLPRSESPERLEALWGPVRRLEYEAMVRAIRGLVESSLPAGVTVAVVSRGDEELLAFDGRFGEHFPQAAGGEYAGYHPGTSMEAVQQVEALRANGADCLLFPKSAFWWLEHYVELREHLERNYGLVDCRNGLCVVVPFTAALSDCLRGIGKEEDSLRFG